MKNHLPTSSCQRSFWMPPNAPVNDFLHDVWLKFKSFAKLSFQFNLKILNNLSHVAVLSYSSFGNVCGYYQSQVFFYSLWAAGKVRQKIMAKWVQWHLWATNWPQTPIEGALNFFYWLHQETSTQKKLSLFSFSIWQRENTYFKRCWN